MKNYIGDLIARHRFDRRISLGTLARMLGAVTQRRICRTCDRILRIEREAEFSDRGLITRLGELLDIPDEELQLAFDQQRAQDICSWMRTANTKGQIMDGITTKLRIEVDGIAVEGEYVTHGERSMTVNLLEPFGGLTTCMCIDLFQPRILASAARAEKEARSLLTSLYRIAADLHEHREALRKRWRQAEEQLATVDTTHPDRPSVIAEEKRGLRRRFRSGEIVEQRQYQRELRRLHEREMWFREDRESIERACLAGLRGAGMVGFEQVREFLTSGNQHQLG